ncbi:hypothetical protein UO65_0161 [Actinokineospora spheciospongiae]|uniref:Uncharacterized protein n=1 Tax=Actinokineospora spheciospongiae TaxID=909613 RepID=W7JEY9_9PSEU|nr:hypothetical protein UO65_0161 [Actinokineospora spheciospongiae]
MVKLIYLFLGCHDLGRAEKMDWEFVFQVEETTCSIASEKFGLRVYVDRDSVADEVEAEKLFQRILQATVKGQKVVEKELLEPIGKEQVNAGDVVVGNQYHRLREAYLYFRDGAEIAFRGDGRVEVQRDADDASNILRGALAEWRRQANADAEGWWNTFAMIMAYFSLLEHTLVGCLAFADFDPEEETVTGFIGLNWGDKFKRLFDLDADLVAQKKYEALRDLAETYRNTYGHGGFDKRGATVHFHVPGVGVIPATLSKISKTPHFGLVPAVVEDYNRICAVLDDFDAWIAAGAYRNAIMWIEHGMDYAFDARSRAEVAANAGTFDAYLEAMSYRLDQAMNMDW